MSEIEVIRERDPGSDDTFTKKVKILPKTREEAKNQCAAQAGGDRSDSMSRRKNRLPTP